MSLLDTMRMDKTKFSSASLYGESDEKAYWQTQTPEARFEAAEFLRQIAYGYDPSTEHMQKTIEVLKLKKFSNSNG